MSAARVAVVGGGLAGLAAAVALADSGCEVHVFEARRQLGGRASSFRDPATDTLVDFCQHVSMGCCTNLADFCRRTGIADCFSRDRSLSFIGPDGRASEVGASRWLPAPLHLAPSLLRLPYLSLGERVNVGRAMIALGRISHKSDQLEPTFGDWLRLRRQSARSIELFWSPVIVSALGETIDRVSLSSARKVFVDGFLAHRKAYEVAIPQRSLSELFGERVGDWLLKAGVQTRTGISIQAIRSVGSTFEINSSGDLHFDQLIVAVPWRQVATVLADYGDRLPWLAQASAIGSSPITGIHLWFDRRINKLDHAVLVGRLSQWLFYRGSQATAAEGESFYYQVVISASRELAGVDRDELVRRICDELAAIWPEASAAKLLNAKVVTEQHAVFPPRPGLDSIRPVQRTAIPGLFVAGDWTATGWPATMEGAVRSGYLAAEGVLAEIDQPRKLLVPDLPRSRLARWLFRR